MEHDINSLGASVRRLQQSFAKLGTDNQCEELFRIIHKPGYTTVAEFKLVTAGLGSLQEHVDVIDRQFRNLVSGARQVGQG